MNPPEVQAANQRLFETLMPYRSTDPQLMQRFQALCVERNKIALPVFVGSPDIEPAAKLKFIGELQSIADRKAWDELPAAPKGQAVEVTPPPAPKPAVPRRAAPPPQPQVPDKKPELVAAQPVKEPANDTPKVSPAMLKFAEALAELQHSADPAVGEDTVRRIVREELASVFGKVANALKA